MKNSLFLFAVVLCVGYLGYLLTSSDRQGASNVDLEEVPGDLLDGAGDDLVLLKFGATWCGPCRKVDQELQKLATYELPVLIRKVDVDENRDLAMKFNISSIPRMILIRNGQMVGDVVGYRSADELREWVNRAAAEATEASGVATENPFAS